MKNTIKLIKLAIKLNNNYKLIEKFSSKVREKDYIFEYESPIKSEDWSYYDNLINEFIEIFDKNAASYNYTEDGEVESVHIPNQNLNIFIIKLKQKIIEEKKKFLIKISILKICY